MARPWFPFYFADYSAKTEHLTLTEHGAYLLLMGSYYKTGCKLSANAMQLQRICRAFDQVEVDAMHAILKQFFILDGDHYIHTRIEDELTKSNEISEKRSKAAKKRYKIDAIAPAIAPANAEQLHTQSQSQSHITITNKPKRKGFAPPSLADISQYCQQRENSVDPETFFDFYSSKGWMVGKNKMKDWKASVRTWEKREVAEKKVEIDWEDIAEKHARPGETMPQFKRRWKKEK